METPENRSEVFSSKVARAANVGASLDDARRWGAIAERAGFVSATKLRRSNVAQIAKSATRQRPSDSDRRQLVGQTGGYAVCRFGNLRYIQTKHLAAVGAALARARDAATTRPILAVSITPNPPRARASSAPAQALVKSVSKSAKSVIKKTNLQTAN